MGASRTGLCYLVMLLLVRVLQTKAVFPQIAAYDGMASDSHHQR